MNSNFQGNRWAMPEFNADGYLQTVASTSRVVNRQVVNRVLVVDDDRMNLALLDSILVDAHMHSISAASGAEAIEVLEHEKVDIVLLDLSMPEMDGFEVLRIIRQRWDQSSLPVIVVTSDDEPDTIVNAFEAGANDYIKKPLNMKVTLARITVQLKLITTQKALRKSRERFELAALGSDDGLFDWNMETDEVYYSPRWNEMMGIPGHSSDADISVWLGRVHPDDRKSLETALNKHFSVEGSKFDTEVRMRHSDGSFRWMLCRGKAIRNQLGEPTRMAGSFTDVTRDKISDPLTGLTSRLFFVECVRRALNRYIRNTENCFSVLFFDLDNFKLINDSLGHQAGDELLIAFAQILKQNFRDCEVTISRLGGDEFAVLFEMGEVPDSVVERLIQNLGRPVRASEGRELFVTTSVGIAHASNRVLTPDDIVREADTAMYHAKSNGKNSYCTYDPRMHEKVTHRLEMATQVRRGVLQNEFCVYFQPFVELKTGKVVALEALCRWNHPEQGLLAPVKFMEIAEENNLMIPIGHTIIQQACMLFAEWKHTSPEFENIRLSVNVAGKQIPNAHFFDDVIKILNDTKLEPRCLQLELTETTLMDNPVVATQLVTRLREHHISVAIDDFGIGYSSLAYLHRLPVDLLKIDRSFVHDMCEHDNSLTIVKAVVTLARGLGLGICAEGIETPEQEAMLISMGCTYGQGYYYSKPMSSEDARQFTIDSCHESRN